MAHSVPLKIAPTLAKFFPELTELRYMSRRPALSCCFMGRSVRGTLAEGLRTEGEATAAPEGAEAAVDAAADGSVEVEVAVPVAVLFAAALTAFATGVPVGFAPAATGDAPAVGSGWPIGVS